MSNILLKDPRSIGKSLYFFAFMLFAPFKIAACIALLWHYIGYSSIIGLLIAGFTIIPLNNFIDKVLTNFRARRVKLTNERLKNLSDCFSTIKVFVF